MNILKKFARNAKKASATEAELFYDQTTNGISYLDKYEVAQYFLEFKEKASECKFSDCLHINEPKCAIKDSVEEGEINLERYLNYLNILDSIEELKEY